jgi:hypothetical protein
MARVMGDGANPNAGTSDMRPADYIALSPNGDSPAAGNTVLPNEITVGDLARAQGVYAHTNGTASYTVTKTFTSDQSITVLKLGILNDASTGTLVFETLLNSAAVLDPGDQVLITETVTL